MPKKQPEENAPKKKKSLAANKRRRKARKNPAAVATRNPPVAYDFTHMILPGFAAYGVTRVLQRIAFSVVGKKWPKAAKHAHAAVGVLTAGATWGFAHKIKKLEPFHDSLIVGSSAAALQGLTAYLPAKYRWLLADCDTADLPAAAPQPQIAAPTVQPTNDIDDEYSELEAQLGSLAGNTLAAAPSRRNAAPAPADDDLMADLGDDGDDDFDSLYAGAFSN